MIATLAGVGCGLSRGGSDIEGGRVTILRPLATELARPRAQATIPCRHFAADAKLQRWGTNCSALSSSRAVCKSAFTQHAIHNPRPGQWVRSELALFFQ